MRGLSTMRLVVMVGAAMLTAAPEVWAQPNPVTYPIPNDDVRAAAAVIYDALASGDDVTGVVVEVFEAVGVPVFALASDQDQILAQQRLGDPYALDIQASAIAHGMKAGNCVTVDSFFTAFNEAGAHAQTPPGPFTRAYLTEQLAPLIERPRIAHDELIPALVVALGRERARRNRSGITDRVWGDDDLDPLQFTLIAYAVGFSGGRPARRLPASAEVAAAKMRRRRSAGPQETIPAGGITGLLGKSPAQRFRDFSASMIGRRVEFTREAAESFAAANCSSMTLGNYRYAISMSPNDGKVNRRWPENPGVPYRLEATLSIRFDFTVPPGSSREAVLQAVGCREFPDSGPVALRSVRWTPSDSAGSREFLKHGVFRPGVQTDEAGQARATFEAFVEVPPPLRIRAKLAGAFLKVNLTNPLPGLRGLDLVWRQLDDPEAQGTLAFTVRYFAPPELTIVMSSTILWVQPNLTKGSVTGSVEGNLKESSSLQEIEYRSGLELPFRYGRFSIEGHGSHRCEFAGVGTSGADMGFVLGFDPLWEPGVAQLRASLFARFGEDYPHEEVEETCEGPSGPVSTNFESSFWLDGWISSHATPPTMELWDIRSQRVFHKMFERITGGEDDTTYTESTTVDVYVP
jgi:hypothetical protein